MVLVLGIVKASLEILGIGIGVKKVVLLRSDPDILCSALYFLITLNYPHTPACASKRELVGVKLIIHTHEHVFDPCPDCRQEIAMQKNI